MKRYAVLGLGLAVIAAGSLQAQQSQHNTDAPYYDLGGVHYPVTTDSEASQTWFDRGLAMCYGFNHEEAVRCFEKSLAADPGNAMAYWGLAYAWGPNINNMLIEPAQIAQATLAVRLARLHSTHCTDLEKALIEAMASRYATHVPEDRDPLNQAYADAMRTVYQQHGNDPLVATLFAESLMNLQPWLHWAPDGKPGAHTSEIVEVLEAGMKRSPKYPSLCHFYIHAMEASPTPEKALQAANHLRDALPDQGHLLHMPTHIDIWLGDYEKVIAENLKAIEADKKFLSREGPLNFYSLYRIHNYHFLVYGAMFDGQSELALQAAQAIKEQVPEPMLLEQVDFLDAFMPTDLHVLVRFGRWEEILKQPEPADYLPMSRSIWHYARALAYAATERIDQAEVEQDSFEEALEQVPETSFLFQNPSINILGVAEEMIAGEIAYRRGEFDVAFEHLREAIRRDDALNYDEPWGWMQPARHALGALLLEQEHYEEAEAVYREDLRRHPKNAWALHGLAECLEKQGKTEELAQCREQFTIATQRTDVKIDRSCYCKLKMDDESDD
ncbi:tetratricopeptide repeat protein [Adhaeretor mobilis]|nr:tetratricopeptide repeat protein [Adhaeretor mobilis]